MKATERYFPVVLIITQYTVILTFESVSKILKYDHSNERFSAVLFYGAACFSIFFVNFDHDCGFPCGSKMVTTKWNE